MHCILSLTFKLLISIIYNYFVMDFYHYDPRDYLDDGDAAFSSAGPGLMTMPRPANRTTRPQAAATEDSPNSSLSICIVGMVLVTFTILVRT
jgi:hypothetical protein